MPRFSLRTLIVVMLLGGPVGALGWWTLGQSHVGMMIVIAFSYLACLIGVAAIVESRHKGTDR